MDELSPETRRLEESLQHGESSSASYNIGKAVCAPSLRRSPLAPEQTPLYSRPV